MGIYVITGGTTGIGAAAREMLLGQGYEVFNIDYKGGDFEADLSTDEGVQVAIRCVEERNHEGHRKPLNLDCRMAMGGTVGEFLASFNRPVNHEIIHTCDDPFVPRWLLCRFVRQSGTERMPCEKERRCARNVPPPRPCRVL